MPTREELVEHLQLEPVNLAIHVVLNNDEFLEVDDYLIKKFGDDWKRPDWLYTQNPETISQFKREIFSQVENFVRRRNHDLYQSICVQMNWCEMRNQPIVENAEALAGVLDIYLTNGIAALSVLLLKRKFLDKLCNCPAQ